MAVPPFFSVFGSRASHHSLQSYLHAFAVSQCSLNYYVPTVCISQDRLGDAFVTNVPQNSVPHKEKVCLSLVFCGHCVLGVALLSHLCSRTRAFSECLWREGGNYGNNVPTLWLRQVIQPRWVPVRWECVPTQLQGCSANGFQAQWCLLPFLMEKKEHFWFYLINLKNGFTHHT